MTPHKLNIETTADGSVTLYRNDLDEHYHSVKGALSESLHVYIDLGWRKYSVLHSPVRVFEVGFGTGLNAALTARAALDAKIKTEYYAIELYPLPTELGDILTAHQSADYVGEFKQVNDAPWDTDVPINPYFTLRKITADLLTATLPRLINVVYFDAFAPEKQPEMWDEPIFRKLYDAMTPEGILTTYCAKGIIRRRLQHTGFRIERLSGPPGGKREVLRATKPVAPA